jgi:hypothetical protein
MMGDRIREAAEQSAGIRPGEQATEEQGNEYFDRLAELGVAGGGSPEGEVLGAGTGRAKRAIEAVNLDDIQWDPGRAYPQVTTRSTDPERPRTIAAGYDPANAIIRVTFRNGVTYEYLGPSPRQWSAFQRAASPGRYIDDVLEQYPYRPVPLD